jgi:hypothetical protein
MRSRPYASTMSAMAFAARVERHLRVLFVFRRDQ